MSNVNLDTFFDAIRNIHQTPQIEKSADFLQLKFKLGVLEIGNMIFLGFLIIFEKNIILTLP